MEEHEGYWLYDGSAATRLWEKSAIGRLTNDGGLLLTDSEIVFCQNHRNLDYPTPGWLKKRIRENGSLLEEAAILEALRVPGNKIVLQNNFVHMGLNGSDDSWALRWPSHLHPNNDQAVAEVRIFHSEESFHANLLFDWCSDVGRRGRIAEALVVDDEQSVVTYRLHAADPMGELVPPSPEMFDDIVGRGFVRTRNGGAFFPDGQEWPSETIGIPLHSGRQVDLFELELIQIFGKAQWGIELDKFSELSTDPELGMTNSANILLDLWKRGLNTRPGFKYGTAWRCYPGGVGEGHAPWLVIDPNEGTPGSVPESWAEACLSSRLASGVNKHWLFPFFDSSEWRYLEISRPPSDSRWNNPNRR